MVASYEAPLRSILFANTRNGMPSRSMIRISARVWAWTPSTAETTSTAPSSTRQGALDLGHEVGVAGGVDEVDLEVAHA